MSAAKFIDKNLELMIMGILLAVFTVLMFINVVLRYVAQTSIVWGDEVCRYALVASTFFSIPIWIRRRSGIRVDAVITLLPKSVQKAADILIYAVMTLFFAFLLVKGFEVYQNMVASGQVSAALHMPTAYLYLVMEIGFCLSVIRSLQVLVEMIRDFNKAEEQEVDGK